MLEDVRKSGEYLNLSLPSASFLDSSGVRSLARYFLKGFVMVVFGVTTYFVGYILLRVSHEHRTGGWNLTARVADFLKNTR